MRGNYPEARRLFRRALTVATRAGHDEHRRAAHHGLLVAALAARDVETALAHGWAAFTEAPLTAADTRAEMLVNLGDVSRHSGEYRAALGACLTALELASNPRIRLPALSCAAVAAAQLEEGRLVAFFTREVERTSARSGQPFEVARALAAIAEAATLAGAPDATALAERAASLARAGGYHEVLARVEALGIRRGSDGRSGSTSNASTLVWSRRSRTVIAALEQLPALARAKATASLAAL
jgi:tetratricopeptide (TPR) repeat protein